MKKNLYIALFIPLKEQSKLLNIMKLTILLNLICLVGFSSTTYSQKQSFTLDLKDTKVKEIFKTIESQSSFRFFYNEQLSDVNREINLSVKDLNIDELLSRIFANTDISCTILENNLIVVAPKRIIQQQKVIGTVTDGLSGEPLPGVNIVVEGTTIGVTTDINGKYSIDLPNTDAVLVFSFLGYNVEKVKYSGQASIDISLIQDVKKLDEVVVIGYGSIKKSDLTGAVASVSSEQLKSSVTTNFDQALQGRIAGLQVTQNSGQPGGGSSIRIRGANSVTGSSEPLYVIDGIPIQGDGSTIASFDWAGGANGQNRVNPLAAINPSDIVKIDVLKDASASAIYGARAANGVILVTTKRGEKGKTKISYNGYYAIQTLPKTLDMMNLREFANYRVQADRELGNTPNQRYLDQSILGEGSDWQNAVFRTAGMQNHQISVSGGSDKTNFAITGSYFSQDGIVINSGFDRFTGRMTLDQQANDWIKIGSTLSYANIKEVITLNDGTDGVIQNALKMGPDVAVRELNGNFGGPASNVGGISYNPVGAALLRNNTLDRQRIMGNVYAEFDITKNLKFRSEFGLDNNHSLNKAFNPTFVWGQLRNNINAMRQREETTFFWNWNNFLTYNVRLTDAHNFTLMLGTESSKSNWENSTVTKYNFASNDIHVLNQGNDRGTPGTTTDGTKDAAAISSYFGRFNYTFKEKYLVTFTLRADGSSKFGANNKWGYFPSGSLAWRITKESFMPQSNILTDMKIRFGYGEVGNQAIDNYMYGSAVETIPTPFGTAYKMARVANPDLKWESTRQYNIGVDMSLLRGRIDLSVNFYKKYTKDMLLQLTVPRYLGGTDVPRDIRAPFANVGKMENKGFDITFISHNLTGKFTWNTDFTFTLNRNKVKELESSLATQWGNLDFYTEFQQATMTRAGYPIGVFYGYRVEGIFQNQEDILNHAVQILDRNSINADHPNGQNLVNRRDGVWIGDLKFVDLNGDGVINTEDREVIGNPNPDWTAGLNNTFSYGSFDLSINLTGSFGAEILNYQKAELTSMTSIYSNQLKIVNNRSRYLLLDPNGSDTDPANVVLANPGTDMPRFATSDNNRNTRMSDRYIEDGSYLRIQTVSLAYTLPNRLTKKVKIERLRIYVTAQNLYTFTNYSGYDPEIGNLNQNARRQNIDMGRYPSPRIWTMGVDVDL